MFDPMLSLVRIPRIVGDPIYGGPVFDPMFSLVRIPIIVGHPIHGGASV